MKAAVLKQIGDEELDVRADAATTPPGPDEVRVRIRAAGICHSDVSAMSGGLPALAPGVMGHEGAGEVVEVGDHVTDLAPGDRVVWRESGYEVRTAHPIYLGERLSHWWAVLAPWGKEET